jgi:CTP:molybdopterin cytidylyltransferase MocA
VPIAVAGVLLAAGEGSRFGQPKALVELDGRTLAERGADLLRAGGADPVLVVTGAAEIQLDGTQTVHNPEWRTGMGSSLRAALQALTSTGVGAAVVALADQPLVGPQAVSRLIATYRDGASVAVATYDGQPRNPVLLAREHWPQVIALATGDTGARPFLRAHPDLVTPVECGDTGRPDDIDTPADLARIAGHHRGSLPDEMAATAIQENLRRLRPHLARAASVRPQAVAEYPRGRRRFSPPRREYQPLRRTRRGRHQRRPENRAGIRRLPHLPRVPFTPPLPAPGLVLKISAASATTRTRRSVKGPTFERAKDGTNCNSTPEGGPGDPGPPSPSALSSWPRPAHW